MKRSQHERKGTAGVISSVTPLAFMLLYFAMIPLFASLYYLMPPGSFYAPYIRLEPTGQSDLSHMATTIEVALHRSIALREIVVAEWKLEGLHVFNPKSKDGSTLEFQIMGTFKKTQSSPGEKTEPQAFVLPSMLVAGVGALIGPRPDETANIMRPLLLDISGYPQSFQSGQLEFYNQLLPMPAFPSGRAIIFTRQEDGELTRLFEGLQGNPIAASWAFSRMLYFSAVVITTVGFGDIVPMTPFARICVALQAIVGVTLAGLFLNAIAYRASQRTR